MESYECCLRVCVWGGGNLWSFISALPDLPLQNLDDQMASTLSFIQAARRESDAETAKKGDNDERRLLLLERVKLQSVRFSKKIEKYIELTVNSLSLHSLLRFQRWFHSTLNGKWSIWVEKKRLEMFQACFRHGNCFCQDQIRRSIDFDCRFCTFN